MFHPLYPQNFAQRCRSTLAAFKDGSFLGTSYTVHYTVCHGTSTVIGFDELMRVSVDDLRHFLRYFSGDFSLLP